MEPSVHRRLVSFGRRTIYADAFSAAGRIFDPHAAVHDREVFTA